MQQTWYSEHFKCLSAFISTRCQTPSQVNHPTLCSIYEQGKNCRGVGRFDPLEQWSTPLEKFQIMAGGSIFYPPWPPSQLKLWNTINELLHRIVKHSFPSSFNLNSLPQSFATFFTNFDLQFYLAPLLPPHIYLQLSNLLSYPASILQQLMNSLHSYLVLLTLLVILIQSLPYSSNNANLFSPQSHISSTYLCPLESFLTNLKTILFLLFSKNPTLTKKT